MGPARPNGDRIVNEYAGAVSAADFDGWTPQLRQEFIDNAYNYNYQVGSILSSETERVEVWHMRLGPGQRLAAHRYVLDYFGQRLPTGTASSTSTTGLLGPSVIGPATPGISPFPAIPICCMTYAMQWGIHRACVHHR